MDVDDVISERKKRRFAETIGILVICSAILIVGVFGFNLWREATRWDPLGEYPLQIISTETVIADPDLSLNPKYAQVGVPAIYEDQSVMSTGVKCVKEGEGVVQVKGVLSWVSDKPPGKIIEISRGAGPRGPNCVNYEFENEVPTVIKEEIARLRSQGINESTWHITGTETPIREDGTTGEPRTWTTTSFVVIHRDAPNG